MNRHSQPGFDEIADALSDFGGMASAAEVHGHYSGLACMLGPAAGESWANALSVDADGDPDANTALPGRALPAALESLAAATWTALDQGDMSLQMLLPDDERSMAERADSLGLWCAGFLHGIGTGDRFGQSGELLSSGATADILADFSELTRAGVFDDETDEEAEAAYAELVEFVRVSVQLVFEELQQIRSRPADARTH